MLQHVLELLTLWSINDTIEWICCVLFTSSSVDGLSGCFQTSVLWRVLLWTLVWMSLLKAVFSSFEYVPGRGTAGVWHFCVQGLRLFAVLSTSHLTSLQQCSRLCSLCPHQHSWASSLFLSCFHDGHFNEYRPPPKIESWITWEESLNEDLSRSSWPVGISGRGRRELGGWVYSGMCLVYVNWCGKIHPSVDGIPPWVWVLDYVRVEKPSCAQSPIHSCFLCFWLDVKRQLLPVVLTFLQW